jgi:hypothetical protein
VKPGRSPTEAKPSRKSWPHFILPPAILFSPLPSPKFVSFGTDVPLWDIPARDIRFPARIELILFLREKHTVMC